MGPLLMERPHLEPLVIVRRGIPAEILWTIAFCRFRTGCQPKEEDGLVKKLFAEKHELPVAALGRQAAVAKDDSWGIAKVWTLLPMDAKTQQVEQVRKKQTVYVP